MFKPFGEAVHKRYEEMSKHELYVVDTVDIFESYLHAFPEGTNPVFRERTEHDCSCCKNFIRNLGNVVTIINGQVQTVWDDYADMPHPYNIVGSKLADLVRQSPVKTVFRTKERTFGTASNFDNKDATIKWNHFYGRVADRHFNAKPEESRGVVTAIVQVFRRGLIEFKKEHFDTVLDLIESNALYRGEEHKPAVLAFKKLVTDYEKSDSKESFVWANLNNPTARFRNTVIGTLLSDIAEGVPLERAVASFESKVAPQNYKRTSALITPKMVDAAVEKLQELGLEGAIHRRYAKLSDVSVNNVLFVDNSVKAKMKDGIADLLKADIKPKTVDIKSAVPIKIEDFMSTVLPKAKSLQVLTQNKHRSNFASITYGEEAKLFRWDNSFAWSYEGEVTDSIKERVKRAGGRVVGAKLRVSLAWYNFDDLDLHCRDPKGNQISFRNKMGILDVDMNAGGKHSREAVENMSWVDKLIDGNYKFHVNQWNQRENKDFGFALEVEAAGSLQQYSYSRKVSGNVNCFTINVKGGVVNAIKIDNDDLVGGTFSQDIWGIPTETLVAVETMMASPNYWDGQAVGNKHWFFLLKGCRNPEPTRGIYNEFLRADLEPHRKVFEVLGSKTKCPYSDEQLSGLGFSSTRNDEATVVIDGGRAYNIQF